MQDSMLACLRQRGGAYDAPYGRRTRGQLHGDKMLGRKCYLFIIPRWRDCGLLGASYAPGKMIMKVG